MLLVSIITPRSTFFLLSVTGMVWPIYTPVKRLAVGLELVACSHYQGIWQAAHKLRHVHYVLSIGLCLMHIHETRKRYSSPIHIASEQINNFAVNITSLLFTYHVLFLYVKVQFYSAFFYYFEQFFCLSSTR